MYHIHGKPRPSGVYNQWINECSPLFLKIRSDQISRSVVSDSLRPHESQHARPPCPSPTPGVHSDSRPSSQWCHAAISSSVVLFSSCPQSLPQKHIQIRSLKKPSSVVHNSTCNDSKYYVFFIPWKVDGCSSWWWALYSFSARLLMKTAIHRGKVITFSNPLVLSIKAATFVNIVKPFKEGLQVHIRFSFQERIKNLRDEY